MLNKEYLLSLAMIAVSLRVSADLQPRQMTNGDSKVFIVYKNIISFLGIKCYQNVDFLPFGLLYYCSVQGP